MKPGLTMEQVVAEVDRQAKAKRDFRAPTKLLKVEPVRVDDDPMTGLELVVGDKGRFPVNAHATNQLAGRLQIPKKYWDLMATKQPDLLAHNVNAWLKAGSDAALVRTLDGDVRAWLTPRYRTIDYDAVVRTLYPVLREAGVEVRSCQITSSRIYVQVSSPRLVADVGNVGDVVEMGVAVSDSEVGAGSYRLDQMLYRRRCLNGLIVGEVSRKNHVGRAIAGDDDDAREVYSDQTLALDDMALLSKVRDTVRAFLSPMALDAVVNAAQRSQRVKIADLLGAAQAVDEIVELNENERGLFRRNLVNGEDGPATGWRVVNALTAVAHDTHDYDRAVELERAGGKLLALTEGEWEEVAAHAYDPKADLVGAGVKD